jgi:ABC-2 type transport system ATP-binding protein
MDCGEQRNGCQYLRFSITSARDKIASYDQAKKACGESMTEPFLQLDGLRKTYGKFVALDGVTLSVAAGEIFGLLGPNGAGKTTLISIVSALSRADAGRVTLGGRRVGIDDLASRWSIGLAPQELAIYEDLTARENLLFFGKIYGWNGADLARRIDEVLDSIGLAERSTERVRQFSGGMKRRLNVGLAILHRPKLLLLDEPTTGVDPQSRNHIFDSIRRLNADGMTVIYTSHYMEEVQSLCRRVAILDHGLIIACDEIASLLRQHESSIHISADSVTPPLMSRISQISGVRVEAKDSHLLEVHCSDVPNTLMQLAAIFNEFRLTPRKIETREPNLERVFLSLTGRALRD